MKSVQHHLQLDSALVFLRWSLYDPVVFASLYPVFVQKIQPEKKKIKNTLKKDIVLALEKVWENYFHLNKLVDIPLKIGRVYQRLEMLDQAIHFFTISLREMGKKTQTLFYLAVCYYHKQNLQQTIALLEETVQLDPNFGKQWLEEVKTEYAEMLQLQQQEAAAMTALE
jgi:tetratricopeptide (TPR) repeat protein